MLRYLVQKMADSPTISDFCRHRLENKFRSIKAGVKNFLPCNESMVLDCGCGTGIFASLVPAANYVGIDVSERCIAAAKSRCPRHRFFKMDARSMSFDSHTFSCVFVVGLLHHLDDQDASDVVSEIHRVLKPAGRLLVFEDVPSQNRWNLLGRAVHALDLGTYIRNLTGYERLLDKSFEVLSKEYLISGVMDYSMFCGAPRKSLKPRLSTTPPRTNNSEPRIVTTVAQR